MALKTGRPKFTDPILIAKRELKKSRRRKQSALNYIKRILAGEQVSIFMKSWKHMHARAKRLTKEIDELNKQINAL